MQGITLSQVYKMIVSTMFVVVLCIASLFIMSGTSFGGENIGPEFDKETIQAFAKAQVKVTRIQTAMVDRDGGKPIDPNVPIKELPQRVKIPATHAIEAQGLTVETYDKLLGEYKTNDALRRQVVRALVNLY